MEKDNHSKKIAFITSSLTAGGAQENVINLSSYLSGKNYQVDIISLHSTNDYRSKESKKYRIISLIKERNTFPTFTLPFIAIFVFFKLCMLIKKENYTHLIGSHEYYPFYLTVVFAKMFKTKSLLLLGNNLREEFRRKSVLFSSLHRFFIKFSFRFTDKLICVSKGLGADMRKNYHVPVSKIETIYNGIDINEIQKLSKYPVRFPYKKNEKVISIVGKLIEKKGHVHLIKSFAMLQKSYPHVKLLIIGKGKLEKTLKILVKDLGIEKKVTFLGFVEHNPYKYFSLSSIFVFSSLYEGFGNVILEAMACGVPIISTNVPYGPSEILDDSLYNQKFRQIKFGKYGVLIPDFSRTIEEKSDNYILLPEEKLLAKAILKLLKNTKYLEHYRRMSLQRVEYFTAEKMSESHEKVIQELIA